MVARSWSVSYASVSFGCVYSADKHKGTLRTRASDYDYPDMTALELARQFGYTQMYDILSPVVRHPIPLQTLQLLQEQFHGLIKQELGSQVVDDQHMHLPQLEVLTELDGELMWFPLAVHDLQEAASLRSMCAG